MKKRTKIIIIVLAVILGLAVGLGITTYVLNDQKVPVLAYHGILPAKLNKGDNDVITDLEKFKKQIGLLKKLGYKSMTLDEFYCWKKGECPKKHKSVLITFDDGYYNNYEYAFKVLKDNGMKAVVFQIGWFAISDDANFMHLDTLAKIKEEYPNIEIASHSYLLHGETDNNENLTYQDFDNDIKGMANIIDSKYYAYPFGHYTKDYAKALKDNGYKLAFTFGPGKEFKKARRQDNDFKVPRLNVGKNMSLFKFWLRLIYPF